MLGKSTSSQQSQPKLAYEWENIPNALKHLAPSHEPVCKGSALDEHLRRLFIKTKAFIACKMLTSSAKAGCEINGTLRSNGYGGKNKFQVKCKCCGVTATWAIKKSSGKPSLAQLVFSMSRNLSKPWSEEDTSMYNALNREDENVLGSVQEHITSVACENDNEAIKAERLEEEEKGLAMFHAQQSKIDKWSEGLTWGNEDIEVDHSQEFATSNKTVSKYTPPENWEDIMDEDASDSKVKDVSTLDEVIQHSEEIVKTCTEEMSVEKLYVLVKTLLDEVASLKETQLKCTCHKQDVKMGTLGRNDESAVNPVSGKPSFADIARKNISVQPQNQKQYEARVAKRVKLIQTSTVSHGEEIAEKMAISVMKLEAKPKRKQKPVVSVFVVGLKRARYGEMRTLMGDIGVPRAMLLNMVWRGNDLEIIVNEADVSTLTERIAAVSKSIKVFTSFAWEKMFKKQAKNKSNKEIANQLRYSSEELISTSYPSLKDAARKSAREAMAAFEQWVKKTDSGKEDDSFIESKKLMKKQVKQSITLPVKADSIKPPDGDVMMTGPAAEFEPLTEEVVAPEQQITMMNESELVGCKRPAPEEPVMENDQNTHTKPTTFLLGSSPIRAEDQ